MTAKIDTKKALDKGKEVAKKTGEFATNNPKSVLYIIGGAIAIYAIYKTAKGISKASSTISGEHIDNNIEVANELSIDESKLSINETEAVQIAAALLEAMNWYGYVFPIGFSHGTNTDVIKDVFERINAEDFKLIYLKFGKKDYNGVSSPNADVSGGIQDFIGLSEKRDLVYWLRSELNKTFDFIVFPKVKKIVEQAGFVFA